MNSSLQGKRVLVTGASSGVGAALSEALSAAGCDLWLVGRNRDRLHAVADRLRANGHAVWPIDADLTIAGDIDRIVETIDAGPGRLDLLIHGAGAISWGSFEQGSAKDFDSQFLCNVRAPYLLTKATLPFLRASHGQIVFLNSTTGLAGKANAAAYSASKHALKGLADSLRDEVNADGIRVLSVFLGRTDTAMQREISRARDLPYDGSRFLQPADVAEVLLPLLQLPARAEVTDFVLRPLAK